jgi:hypothetical protein
LPLCAVQASPSSAKRTRPSATALASAPGETSWLPWPSERISTGRPSWAMSGPAFDGALTAASSTAPAVCARKKPDRAASRAAGIAPVRPDTWTPRLTAATVVASGRARTAHSAAAPASRAGRGRARTASATPAPRQAATAGSTQAR